jgi:hypothetical protein
VKSGINNTKEEIISRINKSNYLLSMINLWKRTKYSSKLHLIEIHS